jgi:uncharacterized protein YoxC
MTTGISMTKGTNKLPIWILGIMLLIVTSGFVFFYLQSSATITNNREMISSLQNNGSSLSSQVESLSVQVISLTNANQTYSNQISGLNGQLTSLADANQTYSSQINSLNSQVTSLTDTNQTYSNQISSLKSQATSLRNANQTYSTQINSLTDQLQLYRDTFGSSVTSEVSPRANGQTYTLNNNPAASNPTYAELMNFISGDKTDQKTYIPGVYVCTDYARDIHNNAEKAGIRAGWVGIDFKNQIIGHACDVFQTSDRGLVYIDCLGLEAGSYGPTNRDLIVRVKKGEVYHPEFIFSTDWRVIDDMGTVIDIQIYW